MTALDTNVIIDLEEGSAEVSERALAAIERAAGRGRLVVCAIVYAEICAWPNRERHDVAEVLRRAHIRIDTQFSLEVLADAGAAYGTYARRGRSSGGGAPRRIIADFLIGAHAASVGSLVTRD
ncbi:MAG TPA: PIN domain-containing protein, partial [Candidatus Baltobacteraceae bacterium]|nr:PIN domain-containing protein [Candidatus Baltobacteraceae bacterium]